MSFGDQEVGSAVTPCPLAAKQTKPEQYWLEIEFVGEDDQPIPWEEYRVVLPDGTQARGYLDSYGFARLENIQQSGSCKICFPNLDEEAWEELAVLPAKAPSGP